MSWADSLYDGPVPDVPDEELDRVRAGFHAATPVQVAEYAQGFAAMRAAVDDTDAYDELVLWYEHDLFDQLNLIHILSRLGRGPALLKPVTLVSIDRHPSIPDFKGMGQLSAADIAKLFALRQPVHEAQVVLAKRAWSAFRSPDPRAIESLLQTDTSALPFLHAALQRHLEEFPSDANGLSRSEQRLLQLADGGASIRDVFSQIHDGERAYYLTDMSMMDRIRELAGASPPLLELSVVNEGGQTLPEGSIALTPAGRDVMIGTSDRIRLCGIDRWLGGVHLTGRAPVWRWSNALRSMQLR